MNVKKSYMRYTIVIFCTFFFLTACNTCNRSSNNTVIGENIIVVENGPGGGKAHFNIFDKDLNLKESKKVSYSVIGTRIQSMDLNKGNVYITTQYENSPLGG